MDSRFESQFAIEKYEDEEIDRQAAMSLTRKGSIMP